MKSQPLVAVVTLNWNGSSFLQECVDSILLSNYENFRVIVVDNGSTDNSLHLLETHYRANSQVIVLRKTKNLGYSLGMNVGLQHGFNVLNAEYCLLMNNDTRLDAQAISALVDVAQTTNDIAFVTGKVFYYDNPDTFQTVGKKSHHVFVNGGHIGRGEIDKGQYDQDAEIAFCDDIFWLVSRHVFTTTGGYDPEFFLQAEDFDWQLRAKNAGFKIMFAYKAMLWHKESMTIGKTSPLKAYYDARNPIIAVIKNCEAPVVKNYMRVKTLNVLIPAIIKNALKGRIKISFSMLRGLVSAWIWKMKHA